MKKVKADRPMRREYDFRGGVRGKYAARFRQRTIAVLLDPDVATVFGDSESVNRALRVLAEVAAKQATFKRGRRAGTTHGSKPLQPTRSAATT